MEGNNPLAQRLPLSNSCRVRMHRVPSNFGRAPGAAYGPA